MNDRPQKARGEAALRCEQIKPIAGLITCSKCFEFVTRRPDEEHALNASPKPALPELILQGGPNAPEISLPGTGKGTRALTYARRLALSRDPVPDYAHELRARGRPENR
jgi:hypothetical protein